MRSRSSTGVDAVCWDWNGTLLDDAAVALAAMNEVLHERGLPVLPHVEAYRAVFCFPVQTFYARLGITSVDFRTAAGRYLELFAAHVGQAQLHPDADAALTTIGRLEVTQVLISATIPTVLDQQMAPHGIGNHFEQILGITDAYAPSKADVVARWLKSSGHPPRRVLMIGDTNHDEEIADDLQVGFVRFARGHQDPPDHDRHPVVQLLRDVVQHVHAQPVLPDTARDRPEPGDRQPPRPGEA